MAKQTINLGVVPDGAGGDTVRSGFTKTNSNFTELYNKLGDGNVLPVAKGGTGGNTQATARDGLGLKSASTKDSTSEFGNSNDLVITQKVVTDKFKELEDSINKRPLANFVGTVWDSVKDTYTRIGGGNPTEIQSKMKRCVLNPNGSVKYFLHPANSNMQEDGVTPSDLTGIDGSNVMVQIPKFYARYTDDGVYKSVSITLDKSQGFDVHQAFLKDGIEVNFRYYPAYEGCEIGGKLRSVSGVQPTVNQDFPTFRTQAKANGTGWGMIDYNLLFAVQTLLLVEFNSLRSDLFIGSGNFSGTNYMLVSGQSNSIGNASSPNTNSGSGVWMSYRGIENFYASMWKMIDGINYNNRVPYVSNKHSTFASDVFTGDYVSVGLTLPEMSGKYVRDYHFTNKGIFPKSITGGSSTHAAGDGGWSSLGSRVFLHGGAGTSGALCGFLYANSNYAASILYGNIGAGCSF